MGSAATPRWWGQHMNSSQVAKKLTSELTFIYSATTAAVKELWRWEQWQQISWRCCETLMWNRMVTRTMMQSVPARSARNVAFGICSVERRVTNEKQTTSVLVSSFWHNESHWDFFFTVQGEVHMSSCIHSFKRRRWRTLMFPIVERH